MKTMKDLKKVGNLNSRYASLVSVAVIGGSLLVGGTVNADAKTSTNTPASTSITPTTDTASSVQAQHLQNIITKGDQEINRRLTTLSTLTTKINNATKLTPTDQTTLSNEVSSTTSGLQSLETQLNGDTTVTTAHTDAEDIYTEYRVYALVAPKVNIIKVADDQQAVEAKLTALAQDLSTRITTEQQAGKDVTTLQSELADMNTKIAAAKAISSNIESVVINLQPSDYNSNHDVLLGDNTQLQTAHTDNAAALNDAKEIVSALKSM